MLRSVNLCEQTFHFLNTMSPLFIYSFLVIHSECIGTCQIPTGIIGIHLFIYFCCCTLCHGTLLEPAILKNKSRWGHLFQESPGRIISWAGVWNFCPNVIIILFFCCKFKKNLKKIAIFQKN
jgi:hypothetical protein